MESNRTISWNNDSILQYGHSLHTAKSGIHSFLLLILSFPPILSETKQWNQIIEPILQYYFHTSPLYKLGPQVALVFAANQTISYSLGSYSTHKKPVTMASMKCYRPADQDACHANHHQSLQHHNFGHHEPQYHSDGGHQVSGNCNSQLKHSQSQNGHGHGMVTSHHQQKQSSSNFSASHGHDHAWGATGFMGHHDTSAGHQKHGIHASAGQFSHASSQGNHAHAGFNGGHHKADNCGHAQAGFKSGHETSGHHKADHSGHAQAGFRSGHETAGWGHAQSGFKSGHETAGHHNADSWGHAQAGFKSGHETAGHQKADSCGHAQAGFKNAAGTTHGHAEQHGSHGMVAATEHYKGEKKCSSSETKMKTKSGDKVKKNKKDKKDKKNKKCGKDSGSSSSSDSD